MTVTDVRHPEASGGAHISGAINIGAGQNLSLWTGWMIESKERLLLVNDSGDDKEACRSLVRVNLDPIEEILQKAHLYQPALESSNPGRHTTRLLKRVSPFGRSRRAVLSCTTGRHSLPGGIGVSLRPSCDLRWNGSVRVQLADTPAAKLVSDRSHPPLQSATVLRRLGIRNSANGVNDDIDLLGYR